MLPSGLTTCCAADGASCGPAKSSEPTAARLTKSPKQLHAGASPTPPPPPQVTPQQERTSTTSEESDTSSATRGPSAAPVPPLPASGEEQQQQQAIQVALMQQAALQKLLQSVQEGQKLDAPTASSQALPASDPTPAPAPTPAPNAIQQLVSGLVGAAAPAPALTASLVDSPIVKMCLQLQQLASLGIHLDQGVVANALAAALVPGQSDNAVATKPPPLQLPANGTASALASPSPVTTPWNASHSSLYRHAPTSTTPKRLDLHRLPSRLDSCSSDSEQITFSPRALSTTSAGAFASWAGAKHLRDVPSPIVLPGIAPAPSPLGLP